MKQALTPKMLERYRTAPTRKLPGDFPCRAGTRERYREELPEETYRILFADGTEPAFSHPYHALHEPGLFRCAACGAPLFGSEAKFDSGTGWPSFSAPVQADRVTYEIDFYVGIPRIAVLCACCGGHLGHVFEDGPKPTGLRYCMNGGALAFGKEGDGHEV